MVYAFNLLPLDPLFIVHGDGTKIFSGVWGMTPFIRCLLEKVSPDVCLVMAEVYHCTGVAWEPVKEITLMEKTKNSLRCLQ